MLLPRELPNVQQFAGDLWSALENGELVLIGCSDDRWSRRWLEVVLEAFDDFVQKKDDPGPLRPTEIQGDTERPGDALALALECSEGASPREVLQSFGGEAVTIVTVACDGKLSMAWRELFREICTIFFRASGWGIELRRVLMVIRGCGEFPPVEADVGVRVRAIWNVVGWEELRLLAESMLGINENPLVRAWRIAVYSAASNGDPDLLSRLCREMPNSVSETIDLALDLRGAGDGKGRWAPWKFPFVSDQRWEVPVAVKGDWSESKIAGITLERGSILNLDGMGSGDARAYLLSRIWREQVSGLFPVVMDMGFSVNVAVKRFAGDGWLAGVPDEARGLDGRLYLEPSEVISRLRECGSSRLPENLWNALVLLRETRNDLAHVRAIEYGRIRELWEAYDRVRRVEEGRVHYREMR